MIYVGVAFLAAFVSLFVYLTVTSIRRGVTSNRGGTWTRADQPMLFWMNVGAFVICGVGGSVFFFALLGSLLQPAG